ncbi:hypothetical protein GGTG_00254 [Gaeumannomyces tritici R3-111a-1]|uniref:C2H2-type domain-containing protein n=1 Tax=Gaeumannomyces tritici (strain R3-111a-1) TaxID=644352 RepID=J3NG61_GAET3|nr:hypothetical protein GGTG_00254 [Gaeumannomyces tritici R3-111a-1]EJT80251.1 hypothetical protein GGTG_00254 [Gaeumannomyces tritici R3-111a-1]
MPPFTLRAREPGQLQARLDIQGAFEDLRALVSPAHTSEFTSTAPEDVRRTAIEVERELAGRQLLRNTRRLDALLRGLDHYSSVVGTLCTGTDHLPWLWAPVKLVLKTSSSCIVAFESLIKVYAQIAEHLGRFEKLHRCFKDNPEFHPTFAAFYVGILAFHQLAYKFVTRRCWKERFATSWGRSQHRLSNILGILKRHGDIIDEVADTRITEARDLRQQLQSWKEAALHKLTQSEQERSECHLESITSWLGIDDMDQVSLQDSLAEVGSQHPGTVDWILRHQDVISWIQPNAKNPFLLLQGGPGTGKSVLSARVLRSLQDSGRSIVLSHFCSYSPSATTRYDVMVKSLLLGCVKTDHDLATHIYDEHVTAKQASIKLLENLLENAVEIVGDNNVVHIILDGMDECPVETQRKIFRLIDRLATNGAACKVLASGRSSMVTLHAKLRKVASTLSLSEEKDCVGEAIRYFVTTALRNMHRRLSEMGLPDQSVPELASRIVAKADGMFLWARLILNYLDANLFYNKAEFTQAIEAIPQELSLLRVKLCRSNPDKSIATDISLYSYAKILSDVLSRCDPRSARRLKGIFGWIAFARRPLQISELQSALLFDTANEVADRPVPNYVLEACGPLVERRKDSTIRFIHISVKEYLQRTDCAEAVRLSHQTSLWDNGLSSLRCLRRAFEVFGPSTSELTRNIQVLRGVWAFLPYTRETWFSELREMATLPKEEWDPSFWGIAQQLSQVLVAPRPCHATGHAAASIPGLEAIRPLEGLWSEAAASLIAESKGKILAVEANDSNCFRRPQSIHDIHANYEWVIQQLISISHHPDINASELEHFREYLTRGAYACRFPLCDASTNKFGSINERAVHEATHAPTFPCLEPGCQYPPFTSGKSLRRHQSEAHESGRPRTVNRGLLMKQVRSIPGRDQAKVKSVPRSLGDANQLPFQDLEVDGPARKYSSLQPQLNHQMMANLGGGGVIARQQPLVQQQQHQKPQLPPGQTKSTQQAFMDNMDIPRTSVAQLLGSPLGVNTWISQHGVPKEIEANLDTSERLNLGGSSILNSPSETAPPPFEKALATSPRLSNLVENFYVNPKMLAAQENQQRPQEQEQLSLQNQEQQAVPTSAKRQEELPQPLLKQEHHQREQPPSQVMACQTQDKRPMYRPEQIYITKATSQEAQRGWEGFISALRCDWGIFDVAPEGSDQKRSAQERILNSSSMLHARMNYRFPNHQLTQVEVAQARAQTLEVRTLEVRTRDAQAIHAYQQPLQTAKEIPGVDTRLDRKDPAIQSQQQAQDQPRSMYILPPPIKNVPCPNPGCPQKFHGGNDLIQHMQTIHDSRDQVYMGVPFC